MDFHKSFISIFGTLCDEYKFSHSSLAQTRFCYEVQDETFCNKSLSVNELKASLPLFGSKIEFAYWAQKLISFSFHCEWSSIQQINLSYPLQLLFFCSIPLFAFVKSFQTSFQLPFALSRYVSSFIYSISLYCLLFWPISKTHENNISNDTTKEHRQSLHNDSFTQNG